MEEWLYGSPILLLGNYIILYYILLNYILFRNMKLCADADL